MHIDTLKFEPARVAAASAQQLKCGTCNRFVVKPPEMELARIARPISACGPGSYCFGGPVRGWCEVHERQQESTGLCRQHGDGGPKMLGSAAVGSANGGKVTSLLRDLLPLEVAAAALGLAAWWDRKR